VEYFDYKTGSQLDLPHDPGFDVESFLEQSQRRETRRLEQELDQIQDQLEKRDELHEEAITELESQLDWYLEQLDDLYNFVTGKQGERTRLKTRIHEFYQEIREEKQQHWKDQQKLEQERRELLRSLQEIKDISVTDIL